MQLFYQADILENQILSEEDTKHLKVLRKNEGDKIQIVDGNGGLFDCLIAEVSGRNAKLQIINQTTNWQSKEREIHIAIAPTKNADRLEWFVEKAVEIGVSSISLIQTEHSERKFQKNDRLIKIAIGAMKQSLQAYLPTINPLLPYLDFIKTQTHYQKFIAHLNDSARPLQRVYNATSPCLLMIGPEGDFSPKEIQLAQTNDFQLVSLGNTRLRTETAGIVACTILNNISLAY